MNSWTAPETLELTLDGLRVAMIHDSGPGKGRLVRMRRRFPDADLVVFGHSHIPLDESGDGLRMQEIRRLSELRDLLGGDHGARDAIRGA